MASRITVVVATRNRAARLALALEGLAAQSLPEDAFEVMVVDNGSTDDTEQRVTSWSRNRRNIHYMSEPVLGLSAARNTGWRATSAPYIAFLDDDAIPATDWLERLLSAFSDPTPRPVCVGGRVEPIYEAAPPAWIAGPLLDYLSVVDHSPTPFFLTDIMHRQKLAGVNMAVERSALDRVRGFSTQLGRIGTHLMSGEDVLIQLQFERLRLPVYYEPAAVVRHFVPRERMTPEWLEQRSYMGGVSDALLSYYSGSGSVIRAARTLTWGIRSLLLSPVATLRPNNGLHGRCEAQHRLGFLTGGAQALYRSLRDNRSDES